MWKFIAAIAALGATLAFAVPAHADDMDAEFVAYLISQNLYVQSSGHQAVIEAKAVCAMLSKGDSIPFVAQGLAGNEPDYSLTMAAKFVGAASGEYCPDLTPDG